MALNGSYSLTPSHGTGLAVSGFPFEVTGPVNLADVWGEDSTVWVAMNYTAGVAALFGGTRQFSLSANTFDTSPSFTYDFVARPLGVIQISFRSKYPVATPFYTNAVRIEAYSGSTRIGRATEYNTDLSVPKNIDAVKVVSLDCGGASVDRVVVYVQSGYAHPASLAAAGYGIELTKFFIEDLSSGATSPENGIYTEDPSPSCGYSEDAPPSCTYAEDPATTCTYTEDVL